jgi:hypothetical protein
MGAIRSADAIDESTLARAHDDENVAHCESRLTDRRAAVYSAMADVNAGGRGESMMAIAYSSGIEQRTMLSKIWLLEMCGR